MSKPAHIILFRILGFLFFLILLAVANIIIPYVENEVYTDVIIFLNINITLLMIITFIGMINELFWSFNLPFNLIAPVTSGILGIFLINFFYKVWNLLNGYFNLNVIILTDLFYILIFLLIIVAGYIIILSRQGKTREDWEERLERHKKHGKKDRHDDKDIEWKDVEKEFKRVFYNMGRELNKLFEPKKKKRR